MKAKVMKRFIDKNSKKLHEVGSVLKCTEERMKEIQKAGNFVVEIKQEKEIKKADK